MLLPPPPPQQRSSAGAIVIAVILLGLGLLAISPILLLMLMSADPGC